MRNQHGAFLHLASFAIRALSAFLGAEIAPEVPSRRYPRSPCARLRRPGTRSFSYFNADRGDSVDTNGAPVANAVQMVPAGNVKSCGGLRYSIFHWWPGFELRASNASIGRRSRPRKPRSRSSEGIRIRICVRLQALTLTERGNHSKKPRGALSLIADEHPEPVPLAPVPESEGYGTEPTQ